MFDEELERAKARLLEETVLAAMNVELLDKALVRRLQDIQPHLKGYPTNNTSLWEG